jgi:energy-coupling factor transporter ATP-binding protein EcfA2
MMLTALDEAVEALDGRADPGLLSRARAVGDRAGDRLRLSGDHTVAALAGSTGSGKSSLFNVLAGADLSPAGVRRPTTSKAHACVWGVDGAAPLVQWLGVPRRQTAWQHGAVVEDQPDLEGLVLLDLPDHDSIELDHRLEVDRLVELVDVLVWVVDPQKYADQALHERYLRRLAGHAATIVVLLNQIDTLSGLAAEECSADLQRLVKLDGLRTTQVLTCSARTGAGLDDVRAMLASAVTRRQARNDRLVPDVEAVVYALAPAVSLEARPEVLSGRAELVEAFASSAGVTVIAESVEATWRQRSEQTLGWPPARWLRALRPDPVRQLQLPGSERREVRSLVHSSAPRPAQVQQARVESAVRRICDSAAHELPRPWQKSVQRAAGGSGDSVRDALDVALVDTDLGIERIPGWWRVARWVQWLVTLAATTGAGWLLLALASPGGLPDPSSPWPGLALLLGGVLIGALLAAVGRSAGRTGAVLRRTNAESRLRAQVEAIADRLVIEPVEAELARHERARTALSQASGESP